MIPTRISDPKFLRMAARLVERYNEGAQESEIYARIARMSLFLRGDDDGEDDL